MSTAFLVIIVILAILFLGMLLKLAADSRGMNIDLGLQNGRLMPCPESPNCVSSEVAVPDSHYIAPFANADTALWERLVSTVSAMDGATLVEQTDNYARFTFRTPLLGFVDDVEFHYRPAQQLIAVRSASRVGYGDMSTNRKRIETIRASLD